MGSWVRSPLWTEFRCCCLTNAIPSETTLTFTCGTLKALFEGTRLDSVKTRDKILAIELVEAAHFEVKDDALAPPKEPPINEETGEPVESRGLCVVCRQHVLVTQEC